MIGFMKNKNNKVEKPYSERDLRLKRLYSLAQLIVYVLTYLAITKSLHSLFNIFDFNSFSTFDRNTTSLTEPVVNTLALTCVVLFFHIPAITICLKPLINLIRLSPLPNQRQDSVLISLASKVDSNKEAKLYKAKVDYLKRGLVYADVLAIFDKTYTTRKKVYILKMLRTGRYPNKYNPVIDFLTLKANFVGLSFVGVITFYVLAIAINISELSSSVVNIFVATPTAFKPWFLLISPILTKTILVAIPFIIVLLLMSASILTLLHCFLEVMEPNKPIKPDSITAS